MVLDEAHTIKSSKSQISMAAAALVADRRWCLTGTPIQVKFLLEYDVKIHVALDIYSELVHIWISWEFSIHSHIKQCVLGLNILRLVYMW